MLLTRLLPPSGVSPPPLPLVRRAQPLPGGLIAAAMDPCPSTRRRRGCPQLHAQHRSDHARGAPPSPPSPATHLASRHAVVHPLGLGSLPQPTGTVAGSPQPLAHPAIELYASTGRRGKNCWNHVAS